MKTVHLIISGKVHGVFFRATAKNMAHTLDINGWIKNLPGHKVEALITGENKQVDEFIDWCKTGPEKAKVEKVTISKMPELKFDSFEIIR